MGASCEAGDLAPEFDLPVSESKRIALAEYRGRKLALFFYPKDDTTGCTAEAVAFDALRSKFKKAGCAVLGVSPDGVKSHAKFKTKHCLKLDLASDEAKTTLQAYGVWAEKSMYGRKYMGVERSTFLIDAEGRIAQVWRKVKSAGEHPEEVLRAAEAS